MRIDTIQQGGHWLVVRRKRKRKGQLMGFGIRFGREDKGGVMIFRRFFLSLSNKEYVGL